MDKFDNIVNITLRCNGKLENYPVKIPGLEAVIYNKDMQQKLEFVIAQTLNELMQNEGPIPYNARGIALLEAAVIETVNNMIVEIQTRQRTFIEDDKQKDIVADILEAKYDE